MKGPKRLVESSENELERILLRAGRDSAPRGAKRRAIVAATSALAVTTVGAGTAAGAAAAGKASATATTFLTLKWVVVVGVASVSVAAGTVAVQSVRAQSAAAAVASETMPARATPHGKPPAPSKGSLSSLVSPLDPPAAEPAALAPSSSPPEAPPVAPAPVIAVPAPSTRLAPTALQARVSPAVVTSPSPSVSERSAASAPASKGETPAAAGANPAAELAILDQAREAIGDREPARGISILDDYGRRFPSGVMGPEASILRIEALVASGDRDGAKRAGDAFLRANPASPYASRIASLLAAPRP